MSDTTAGSSPEAAAAIETTDDAESANTTQANDNGVHENEAVVDNNEEEADEDAEDLDYGVFCKYVLYAHKSDDNRQHISEQLVMYPQFATPLLDRCLRECQPYYVDLLLEKKADLLTNRFGEALGCCSVDVVRRWLDAGCKLDSLSEPNALVCAFNNIYNSDVVRLVLAAGVVNVNGANEALSAARTAEQVDLLLEHKADLNADLGSGATVIDKFHDGSPAYVRSLLQAKADVTHMPPDGCGVVHNIVGQNLGIDLLNEVLDLGARVGNSAITYLLTTPPDRDPFYDVPSPNYYVERDEYFKVLMARGLVTVDSTVTDEMTGEAVPLLDYLPLDCLPPGFTNTTDVAYTEDVDRGSRGKITRHLVECKASVDNLKWPILARQGALISKDPTFFLELCSRGALANLAARSQKVLNEHLEWAIEVQDASIVKALLEGKADPSGRHLFELLPSGNIHNTGILKLLLEHKADPCYRVIKAVTKAGVSWGATLWDSVKMLNNPDIESMFKAEFRELE